MFENLVVLFPVHPNPRVQSAVAPFRRMNQRFVCVDPLNYKSIDDFCL